MREHPSFCTQWHCRQYLPDGYFLVDMWTFALQVLLSPPVCFIFTTFLLVEMFCWITTLWRNMYIKRMRLVPPGIWCKTADRVSWSLWAPTSQLWSKNRSHSAQRLNMLSCRPAWSTQLTDELQNKWLSSQISGTISKEM
jgi:hypothetical protein